MTGLGAIAFGTVSILVLVSALWVVTLSNLFRAALSLGVVLLGVAALFILLEAEFLAFVQILVYVGAILTLVVFAIMLTGRLQGSPVSPASRQRLPAAVASLSLFAVLVSSTLPMTRSAAAASEPVALAALGQELVKTLVLPFEVISLVFVAALVGAIAIAAAPREMTPPSEPGAAISGGRTPSAG